MTISGLVPKPVQLKFQAMPPAGGTLPIPERVNITGRARWNDSVLKCLYNNAKALKEQVLRLNRYIFRMHPMVLGVFGGDPMEMPDA